MTRTASTVEIPEPLAFLFERGKWRYKVAYGGRGGGKSWAFAVAIVVLCAQVPLRVLCAREYQISLDQSVYRLLVDTIQRLGIPGYDIQASKITHANGSEINFAGLRRNVHGLKSFEGIDIVWVEEGQTVSADSWGILVPTIRKQGSEIWISFNPELDSDLVYEEFVVHPRADAKVVRINWDQNPWLPDTLRAEAEHMRRTNPLEFEYIWQGRPRPSVQNAIYADCLAASEVAGRIGRVPMEPSTPVSTAWDLGFGDATAVWFFQRVAGEVRVLSYLEDRGKELAAYLKRIQAMGWLIDRHYLPWDGGTKQLQTGQSIEDKIKAIGHAVTVIPQHEKYIGIDEVRTVFPLLWFDADGCKEGLNALKHYRWATSADGERRREPKHDWASHGADALRTLAMGIKQARRSPVVTQQAMVYGGGSVNKWAWT